MPTRYYDWNDNIHMAIAFEFDRDLNHVHRKVYGILDFLGDIGGLAGSLHVIFGAGVIIFRYKAVLSYMSNRLFVINDGDEIEPAKRPFIDDNDDPLGI